MRSKPVRQLLTLAGLALLTCGLVWGRHWLGFLVPDSTSAEISVEQVRAELQEQRFDRVQELTAELLKQDPDNEEVRLLLAEANSKQGDLSGALKAYEEFLKLSDDPDSRLIAYQCAGEIYLQQGRAAKAEQYLKKALQIDPFFAEAHNRLAFKLGLEGRRWESMDHLFELIKLDRFSTLHLLLLASPQKNVLIDDYANTIAESGEEYPIAKLPEAKRLIEEGQFSAADSIVREILDYDPDLIEAKMLKGQLLLLEGHLDEFQQWSHTLTLADEEHPLCWDLRGRFSMQNGDLDVAVRCFAETFFRDPNNLPACKYLAQLLPRLDEDEGVIDYFSQRAKLLEELEREADQLFLNQNHLGLILKMYVLCDKLERFWEAWGWLRAAVDIEPRNEFATRELKLLEGHMVSDLPRTILFKGNMDWDYRKYPLPEWHDIQSPSDPVADRRPAGGRVAFEDVAADLGIEFNYELGPRFTDLKEGYFYMYQMTCGGVAAFDYDRNGYPDLYFAQGAKSLEGEGSPEDSDQLFRNLGGVRFLDVTEPAGIIELKHSQGANAGDLNNDGFPDLYVGNIGRNVLFWNNGDGTFTRSEDPLIGEQDVWTTSVAIADLDGDSVPDLYDVDYLEPEAFYRLCEEDGYKRACSPRVLKAERDRILRGRGDGTFEDVSDAFPVEADEGRGLGLLIADFLQLGRPQILIANDTSANNFYQLTSPAGSERWELRDESMLRGIAFDTNGRAQACMGIAMADFDSNLTQDVFVTNFYADYNTLYILDKANDFFSDLSQSSNMAAISYPMLGFGTQVLDPDRDGLPDLFVANGHVDNFLHKDIPLQMRPQFIRNLGGARFEELTGDGIGEYFQRKLLGRAVAKLDFNRDLNEDLVVTHVESPPALLENRSEPARGALALSFVGTRCSRDAVGARLRLEQAGRVSVQQVTAGSGYFAANENQTVFAVDSDQPFKLTVIWPSGETVVYSSCEANHRYTIVEGYESAVECP